jgi:hypothetical protein
MCAVLRHTLQHDPFQLRQGPKSRELLRKVGRAWIAAERVSAVLGLYSCPRADKVETSVAHGAASLRRCVDEKKPIKLCSHGNLLHQLGRLANGWHRRDERASFFRDGYAVDSQASNLA